jgi:hypothetical protein
MDDELDKRIQSTRRLKSVPLLAIGVRHRDVGSNQEGGERKLGTTASSAAGRGQQSEALRLDRGGCI